MFPILAVLFISTASLFPNGFTEPPAVLYGKVIHLNQGATYQVFSGTLRVTLVNELNPTNTVTVEAPLGLVGPNGEFSYRVEIPQKYLPSQTEMNRMLAVSSVNNRFHFAGITVDGTAAQPLDSAQSLLATSFSKRGSEHRLDLKVTLPQSDSDGDGIPDWWENRYGLNPLYAGDAQFDDDSDGWTALAEFLRGTDPTNSNAAPIVSTTSILVPVGGKAGFHLTIHDSDSASASLQLNLTSSPESLGLYFFRSNSVLGASVPFTYADVLAGNVYFQAASNFVSASLPLTLQDGTNSAIPFQVLIKGFSPATHSGVQPAIWLNASDVAFAQTPGTPVTEWADNSEANRDGYQAITGAIPVLAADGSHALEFDGSQFFYVDDRALQLGQYTAFMTFGVSDFAETDQTIFQSSDLRVAIGGDGNALSSRTLRIQQPGRNVNGPALAAGGTTQITLAGGTNSSFATVLGETLYPSFNSGEPLDAVFATIGARQSIVDVDVSEFFSGSISEVLIYDQLLDAGARSRHEDYQLSRWTSLVVWDDRDETSPVSIKGLFNMRNSLNGGWGNDQLTGGDLSDILRGGPGVDSLTGGNGGDRFQFFKGHGNDLVTDFSETSGDIIDLTPIFADLRGSPTNYISLRVETVRGDDNIPRVNTMIDLKYTGGGAVDQTIKLQNKRFIAADLRRLVGEGVIQLGGPQYDTTVSIAAVQTNIVETEVARTLTLTRSGNLDAALTVNLSFVGSANVEDDYKLSGLTGNSVIRTISFARGESTKTINLTPIQDIFPESETIHIGILSDPRITSAPISPFSLSLEDAPVVSIETLTPYASRLGQIPGLVKLSRSGPVTESLNIALYFSGSAVNGNDYDLLSPSVVFPAGVRTLQLGVRPTSFAAFQDRAKLAQISVVPDATRFVLTNPWTASVIIVDAHNGSLNSFSGWRQAHFPGNSSTNLATTDPDGDFFSNLLEYVYGSNPNQASSASDNKIGMYNSGGYLELHVTTASGLSDVQLALQSSTNFTVWHGVDDIFDRSLSWRTDGRLQRIYRSRVPASSLNLSSFYRLGITQTNSPATVENFAQSLGMIGQPFLARSGPAWIPAESNQIISPKLTPGQSSEFATFVAGPFIAVFEWKSDLGETDEVVFYVDDTEVGRLGGQSDWMVINYSEAADGLHHLRWHLKKNEASTGNSGYAWMRNLSVIEP